MNDVIEVKNLTRIYETSSGFFKRKVHKVNALNGLTFTVKKGEIFGLLGPNGAGKTTTIKILSTLLAQTSGESKVLGYNTFGEEDKIRKYINFIFGGEFGVYRRLTGRDNLRYFGNLYKLSRKERESKINELIKLVGLEDKADERVETYSKGMIQRLQIARGLINSPQVLFLDEPTIGLDPVGARQLRNIIRELSEKGITIILTTHYMFEADELCNKIAIVNKGKIVALDTPENLKKNSDDTSVLEITMLFIDNKKVEEIKKIEGVIAIDIKKQNQYEIIRINFLNSVNIEQKVLSILENCNIIYIHEREATLEDAYIKLVGGSI